MAAGDLSNLNHNQGTGFNTTNLISGADAPSAMAAVSNANNNDEQFKKLIF